MSPVDPIGYVTVNELRAAQGLPALPAYTSIYEGMVLISREIFRRTYRAPDLVFTFHPGVAAELLGEERNGQPVAHYTQFRETGVHEVHLSSGTAKILVDSQAVGDGQALIMWADGHLKHMTKWDVRSGELPDLKTERAIFDQFSTSEVRHYIPPASPKLTNEQYAQRRQRMRMRMKEKR